jgi:hypothetical protein
MGLEPVGIIEICNKIDVECEAFYGFDIIGKVISSSMSILKKIPAISDELLERVESIKKPIHVVVLSGNFDGLIGKIRQLRKKGAVINLIIFIGKLDVEKREKLRMYGINAIVL